MNENTTDKTEYQAELFSNRLKKKYKELRKWARKNRITCYRLYDRDIPEIPLSVDLYEFLPSDISTSIEAAKFLGEQNLKFSQNDLSAEQDQKSRLYALLYFYERPYEKDETEEELWLNAMIKVTAEVLGIDSSKVILKYRGKKNHKNEENSSEETQYTKNENQNVIEGTVCEQGQLFKVNLSTYLDTGLFLDHRNLRNTVRETSSKKRVLNLFCYTGSFSVYAASGNASFVESVDLSNTYLESAKQNLRLNGFSDKKKYVFTRADCARFLQEKAVAAKGGKIAPEELYDIIILDPPTFSNSKATSNAMDINKDWSQLVKDCLNILNPSGILYFSTNSQKIKMELSKLPPKTAKGNAFTCKEITEQTIPQDFAGKKPHKVWSFVIEKSEQNSTVEKKKDKVFL